MDRRRRARAGFTLVETVFALLVASVLINMGRQALVPARDRMAISGARTSILALQARARAHAVERGSSARLNFDPVGDSVWITLDGTQIERLLLGQNDRIDVMAAAPIRLCIGPRGFADPDCNSFTSAVEVGIRRGAQRSILLIRPLGQIQVRE